MLGRPLFLTEIYAMSQQTSPGRACFCMLSLMAIALNDFAVGQASETFPYKAIVATPAAPVLSGPGENYYATDTLPESEVVEVYREEKSGWCAVRPPEGSFSWVYARHVEKIDPSLLEVNKEDVASRIGSRLSEHRSAVQVRLERGEVLQILGGETVAGQTWFKVAPPAGEFRWIHRRHLQRQPATEFIESQDGKIITVSASEGADGTHLDRAIAEEPISASRYDDISSSTEGMPFKGASDGRNPIESSPEADVGTPAANPAGANPIEQPVDRVPSQPKLVGPPAAQSLDREIAGIELRLSRTVSEPPATWNIEELVREAQGLLGRASSHSERESIQRLLNKLGRFSSIHQRHARLQGIAPSAALGTLAESGNPLGTSRNTLPIRPQSSFGAQYDAVGILRPVVSKRPGAPQFALVDERGQVLSFVSTTPDTNLQPYIGQRVGVFGNRGFIPEFQRAHVMAGRVTPINEGILR